MDSDFLKIKSISCIPDCSCRGCPSLFSKLLSFYCICLKRRKKSMASFLHFWVRPLNRAHTFHAKGHSHNKWQVVLGSWWQNSQFGSTLTRFLCKLACIGKQFEQTLQMKEHTFSNTFNFQIFPHIEPWDCTNEYSARWGFFRSRATW